MVIAAFLLDEAGEDRLADWLMLAKPDHARAVATGVATLALLMGLEAVWNALAAVDAMDVNQSCEWIMVPGIFEWGPKADALWTPSDAAPHV